ncbi:MAG: hypothetical protein RSF79_21260 [Janthinobacterium sp.]
MHESSIPGTEGYADNAEQLIARYDSVIAADKKRGEGKYQQVAQAGRVACHVAQAWSRPGKPAHL